LLLAAAAQRPPFVVCFGTLEIKSDDPQPEAAVDELEIVPLGD
jgi:hypothetical protein